MAVNLIFMGNKIVIFLLCAAISVNSQTTAPSTTTTTPAPTTSTAEPTTVPENTGVSPPATQIPGAIFYRQSDLGVCTCDLTGNGCDVNCCCDPDCTQADRDAFSACDDDYTPPDNKACVKSSVIFRENTPYTVSETSGGLFCVLTDNYEERNYYEVPETVTNATFDEYVAKYGGTSFKRETQSSDLPTTYYKSGDPLLTVYETNAVGRLGLPRALTSKECADNNPAAFLYDQTFACVRKIQNLAVGCDQNPTLNANTYFAYFKIISTPEIFDEVSTDTSTTAPTTETQQQNPQDQESTESVTQGTTSSSSNDDTASSTLYDSPSAINITVEEPLICMDSDGFNSTCTFSADGIPLTPTWDGDTCANVVIRVEYVITQNSTDGVTEAKIRLVFANITEDNLPLNQVFVSNFQKVGEENTTERSGNPGYVVGQPLLAGTDASVTDIGGIEKQVIEMDSNRYNGLAIVTSSARGDCLTDPAKRMTVTFGENMRSGCKISVTFNNMTQICQLISDAAVVALQGSDPPTRVATFGNVTVEDVGDWLPIFDEAPSQTGSTSVGYCTKVVVGMHIEVLYANVGSLGNPQAKIIGVQRRFQQKDISFQCVGPYCQSSTQNLPQCFEITSSVEFIDASEPTVAVDAEYPEFTARLPEDFFYPFT